MGGMFLRHEFASPKRCDKCGKPRKFLYHVELDEGLAINVCSGTCAELSRQNYQEKKDKNITPGRPAIEEPTNPDMLEDNTDLEF